MKKLITCLAAVLLMAGAQSMTAQTTNSTDSTTNPTPPAKHQGMSPEQRKAFLKVLGLTPADLKGLSREDRQAKMKEAAQKAETDLQAKKAAGTLTPEEQTNLNEVEKFLKHGHKKPATPPANQ